MPEFDQQTRDLLAAMLLMAGLLVVVAIGIQVIAVYRRRLRGDSGSTGVDLAESLREAFEAGEMSEEEYRRVREAMERRPASLPPRTLTAPPRDPIPPPPDATGADAGEVEGPADAPDERGDATPP